MSIRTVDVLNNLKNHDFDIQNFPLCKAEAEVCMEALKLKIHHDHEIEEARKAMFRDEIK